MHPRTLRLALALSLPAAVVGCKSEPGKSLDPGQAALRRLTPTEYNNTIRDLFGHRSEDDWYEGAYEDEFEDEDLEEMPPLWPQSFPPEVKVHGFEGFREGQIASPYLAERYQTVASHYGTLVTKAPHFWTCDVSGLGEDAAYQCSLDSVLKFASRAYRRDLTADERAELTAFHAANADDHGVETGVRLTVAGVLNSPQFLYLAEPSGGDKADWEMASRLSYFLYDSMPDPALFAAAAEGRLSTEAEVEAQVRRMLGDWRAREAVVHFHSQWLDLERVYATRADFETYMPLYMPEAGEGDEDIQEIEEFWSASLIGLRTGMVREAELFVERTVFDGAGTLSMLLTDNHGFVTELHDSFVDVSTADFYGVPASQVSDTIEESFVMDDGNLGFDVRIRQATYPADQRSGVLTQGAVLTTLAHPVHPAPVLRGVFVLERLTCQPMGQPPDGAEASAPPDSPDAEATNRVRLEAATADPVCSSCHDRINPVGFAFENFDSVGGWRNQDNGQHVDASGSVYLPGEGEFSFSGPVELGQVLAGSRQVHDCYAEHWTRYALGRELGDADETELTKIKDSFWRSGGDVPELLVSIATSPLFRSQTPTDGGH